MPKKSTKLPAKPQTKIDKRTKHGTKIDLAQVVKLKDVNKLSFRQIGKQLGFNHIYVKRVYDKFANMVQDSDITNAFSENRTKILSSLELALLQDLGNEGKREKASLNNTAYAFQQIHTARRLEEGKGTAGGVTINIEVAYQEATDLARQLRMKHAGSGVTGNKD